ncbi:MAG TPA: hypothetical protein PKN32_06225 [Bacteroidales bacterium]|nr:hypothetical protein [Bacteroidales bacterium]
MEKENYILVSDRKLDELIEKIDKLQSTVTLQKQDGHAIGDYIPEKEAKLLLGKGTTWFWNKRQTGELKGKKAGNTWYYKKSQITKFIENGKSI